MELAIRIIADYAVFLVVILAVYAICMHVPQGQRWQSYCRILMAGLTALLLAKVVALFFQPELARPYQILGVEPGASYRDNPGFPSDHALFVVAIFLAVWFETRRKWLIVIIGVLAAGVCIGRVLALVHTPIDVIGGIVFACMGAVWYIKPKPSRMRKNDVQ